MTRTSMPAEYFCPTCGVHNRSQDCRGSAHVIKPECPVCEDKRRTGELPSGNPAADLLQQQWRLLTRAAREAVGLDLRGLRL